ncbi:MAG TPA: oligosaccharide flippase family protein [Coriobacteriia bacterium]|nr:oligosaccharide flippase family protein [Coriobacteriia bacterium]
MAEERSIKRTILTNTAAGGLAQFVSMAASLVFMPLLVRQFTVQGFGLYMLATTVTGYTWVLDFGVGATIQKRVAELSAKHDTDGIGEVVSAAWMIYLAVGVLSAAVLFGIARLSGTVFKVSAAEAQLLQRLLYVAALQSLLAWPLSIGQHVLAGLQKHVLVAYTSLLVTFGTIAAIVATLVTDNGPLFLFVATTAVILVGAAVNTVRGIGMLKGTRLRPGRGSIATMRTIAAFSWPIFLLQLFGMVLYQQTDRLVLMVFLGAIAVGLYEAVGKFQGLITQLVGISTWAVMPMASDLDARQHDSGIRTLFLRGTKLALVLIAPVVLALMIFARPLLLRWMGSDYIAVALAAQVMVAHQLLSAGVGVGDSMITGRGRAKARLPYIAAVAAGNLALSVALAKPLGVLGVVLGTAIPYLIEFPFHIRFLLKELDVPFRRWLKEVVLPVYPLLLVPLCVGVGITFTPLMHSLLGVAVAMGATVASYWLVIFAFALSDNERAEVRLVLSKIQRRAA